MLVLQNLGKTYAGARKLALLRVLGVTRSGLLRMLLAEGAMIGAAGARPAWSRDFIAAAVCTLPGPVGGIPLFNRAVWSIGAAQTTFRWSIDFRI
jgi:hypothetical protein